MRSTYPTKPIRKQSSGMLNILFPCLEIQVPPLRSLLINRFKTGASFSERRGDPEQAKDYHKQAIDELALEMCPARWEDLLQPTFLEHIRNRHERTRSCYEMTGTLLQPFCRRQVGVVLVPLRSVRAIRGCARCINLGFNPKAKSETPIGLHIAAMQRHNSYKVDLEDNLVGTCPLQAIRRPVLRLLAA